jgi:hypothetical protein
MALRSVERCVLRRRQRPGNFALRVRRFLWTLKRDRYIFNDRLCGDGALKTNPNYDDLHLAVFVVNLNRERRAGRQRRSVSEVVMTEANSIFSFFFSKKIKKIVPVVYRTKATNTLLFSIISHLYHYAKNGHKF